MVNMQLVLAPAGEPEECRVWLLTHRAETSQRESKTVRLNAVPRSQRFLRRYE